MMKGMDFLRVITDFVPPLVAAVGLTREPEPEVVADEEPLRAELFSLGRLEQFARELAAAHVLAADGRRRSVLLERLEDNGRFLDAAYRDTAESVRQGKTITPAAEWFMDNFHIVQEQVREIKEDLPGHYERELPKLARGAYAGYPRVYAIAVEMITHSDCRLDAEALRRFTLAYQFTAPLRIGELWAVAIMLRLALVENLRRLARQSLWARAERERADAWADRLLETAERQPTEVFVLLAERERIRGELSPPFAVQLLQRLRDQGPGIAPVLIWLEQRLAGQSATGDEMIRVEHQRQAANQVTVGNVITSMRLLSTINWSEFVERTSLVEQVLRDDPAETHALMDFETRDSYRKVIERVAKRAGAGEVEVARRAAQFALESRARDADDEERAHVGYYLIGRGRARLEAELNYWPTPAEILLRAATRYPAFVYLGTILLLTGLIIWLLLSYARGQGAGAWELVALALLLLLPASDLAVSANNRDVTTLIRPRVLPKLEFRDGIPPAYRTMVVVPSMLVREENVRELIEHLEIHYLANQEEHLHFALLSDWADAPAETLPSDEPLLALASAGIRELNHRYAAAEGDRFYLFHRRRLWNPREGVWMGWERKRGKLEEFNRLLRGASDTSYAARVGDVGRLGEMRYVITLDADTQLPRDAARRLVGAMAHPLNRARYDARAGRVVEGYGILQPRVSVTLRSAGRSRFTRIFSGDTGVDPYTTAISDMYMDLFGEGNFVGKGIYDVDAFERALRGRIPENLVLSHDLLEGLHARTALATDIELFDDYPSTYLAYAARQHRWARGDWQILRWLGSGLPLLSKWKIFDNLRRSLVAPGALLLLVAAWTFLPGSPLVWTLFVLLTLVFPVYGHLGNALMLHPRGVPWTSHLRNVWGDALRSTAQVALTIAFLPHQAYLMLDAVARTLARMLVTRRKLLEWVTAAQAERRLGRGPAEFWRRMLSAPLIAAGLLGLIAWVAPGRLPEAAPFLLVWLLSPLIAYLVSEPLPARRPALEARERAELRLVARKTWRFFETFVGPEDHYLPPDNFQEDPKAVVAHRTSPTNIGLGLLSTLAAHDFGYLSHAELAGALDRTFATLSRLERLFGHYYNWYDTQTLAPLPPAYISTVDSGNLAGHLLALKQGCHEALVGPIIHPRILAGMEDARALLAHELRAAAGEGVRTPQVERRLASLAELLARRPGGPGEWGRLLAEVAAAADELERAVRGLDWPPESAAGDEARYWAAALAHAARAHRDEFEAFQISDLESEPAGGLPALEEWPAAAGLAARFRVIAARAEQISAEMDFGFLFDERRQLFIIGYNAAEGQPDNSYYDLLASEARLASFVAIARDQVPQQHWFRLGRAMTRTSRGKALLSWTATMFEYLMPLLVMRTYEHTLLDDTYQTVVKRQVEYGAQHGVPWGISESAYSARDLAFNYQYQAFGVPGLGLKRGLSDDLVVAPYATALALPLRPRAALRNLRRLAADGLFGRYGFYEAVDYTPARVPKGEERVPIRAFMAHHQGMSLIALDNCLHDHPLPRRFHAEPLVQATELLLQERIPRQVPLAHPHAEEVSAGRTVRQVSPPVTRQFNTPRLSAPQTHLLSNGNYTVMVTHAGGGFSRWRGLAVTRWREDATRDHWGAFCYVRDAGSGDFWSTGYQPTLREPQSYLATFSADKAEFHRLDDEVETHTEIAVSPEEDAEVRRITLTNRGDRERELEVTSYSEVVLARSAADAAHPAFSNLSVQSEFIAEHAALLFTRRPRTPEEKQFWVVHVLAAPGAEGVECETDRARFLGRGRTPRAPAAVTPGRPLSGTTGAVLDPIASLRRSLRLEPGESARLTFVTAVAETREAALELADKYHEPRAIARALALAWTHSQVELRHLNISAEEAHLFQRLASRALYATPELRPSGEVLSRNTKQQSGLWAYGVSGDLPVILVRIAETSEAEIVRQLLRAHEYWRLKGVPIDLVILNEHPSSYAQGLHEYLLSLIRTSPAQAMMDKPGGIFLRRADFMPEEDRYLLLAVARAVLVGQRGTLAQQLERRGWEEPLPPLLKKPAARGPRPEAEGPRIPDSELAALDFFNGLGGFAPDGREYVMIFERGRVTPAPWVNVVANQRFGFMVTESGGGYTWSENSRENRLTPWSNDPVSDPAGEAVYLRDEETGEFWTIAPGPVHRPGRAVVRHGQGYTAFERRSQGLRQELTLFVPPDDPVKIFRLRVKNEGAARRRLSATAYFELALGVARETAAQHVVTEVDATTGALLARNNYNNEFAHRVAFADVNDLRRTLTGNRAEFLGRNGGPGAPAALSRVRLSGRVGAGLDPCAALQTVFELAPGEEREVVFTLGEGDDLFQARELIKRYRQGEAVAAAFEGVTRQWDWLLGAVEVRTPDASMDLLLNRWLLYQTLACRIWGRSAFYQSGGAYGFRDQLQDTCALVYAVPAVPRDQILRAASRQFVEGDVQHWWHPPTGRGVRTRFSDDLHWLPFVTCFYVRATGDEKILDEPVPFLEGRPLEPHEDEYYGMPSTSDETGTLYEHCARALDRGLEVGAHGLPLMGSGDWNDGMNRVGNQGRGESVWVGWFLHATMTAFAEVAAGRGDLERAGRYRRHTEQLSRALEQAGWDGAWYRRAYFDDGTPLGSTANEECRIDSIAQSWGVISGAAPAERARRAMAAVEEHLVRREDRLILLFTPPFDRTPLDPGYIKGYVPGVRENGGQYTHAAIWTVLAFALLGDGERAGELFAMINPINHARTPEEAQRYKVEPYAVAADVYSVAPHAGRGGWTWYTGSAAWLYRVGLEAILGFRLHGSYFTVEPCIPASWPKYEVTYRRDGTRYNVIVENPDGVTRGVARVEFDGAALADGRVPLDQGGASHEVRVIMG